MVRPEASFWRGKRVLVTGHTGFKGAWLSLWLAEMGAEVTGFSLEDLPSEPSLFDLAVRGDVTHVAGDLRDAQAVQTVVEGCKPEVIFHLAAQSLVRESYDDPVGTYATNVMGSLHLLEAARSCGGVQAMVNVTSDKCYENKGWHWGYREDEPMGGHDPYSSSKGCMELLSSSYRRSYLEGDDGWFGLATVRAGNVIGGGDWAKDRIVPDCVRSFAAGEAVVIRNPLATRPWQHVLDPLCGYIVLAEKLAGSREYAQGWNFGPADEDAENVEYIVSNLVSLWGGEASWEPDKSAQPHEARYLKVDSSKARAELGWAHGLPVAEALAWSVEWYKGFYGGDDAKALCLKQITTYQEL